MGKDKIPIPKDLGIEIGSDLTVFWTEILNKSEKVIFSAEREIEIQKNIAEMAKFKLKEEKLK